MNEIDHVGGRKPSPAQQPASAIVACGLAAIVLVLMLVTFFVAVSKVPHYGAVPIGSKMVLPQRPPEPKPKLQIVSVDAVPLIPITWVTPRDGIIMRLPGGAQITLAPMLRNCDCCGIDCQCAPCKCNPPEELPPPKADPPAVLPEPPAIPPLDEPCVIVPEPRKCKVPRNVRPRARFIRRCNR